MIRDLIARWISPSNPARDLSKMQHQQHRDRVKATARQICAELGQPIPEILK